MALKYRLAKVSNDIAIEYIDSGLPKESRGTAVLLHGFPQTAYQFRHVISPLSQAGYRVLVPNYRGAGKSSKPTTGFTKSIMARDIVDLLDHLSIRERVHVVGHDIGGMIAFAIALRHPERLLSVNWGECPLPKTSIHQEDRTDRAIEQFHFILHCVTDLPEALVAGKEDLYLTHFFNKLAYNTDAISNADLEQYVAAYSQPGAMRCAFEHGKCKVPATSLSGAQSGHKGQAEQMFSAVHEAGTFEIREVDEAGHYLAEENPQGFVEQVLDFISKHSE